MLLPPTDWRGTPSVRSNGFPAVELVKKGLPVDGAEALNVAEREKSNCADWSKPVCTCDMNAIYIFELISGRLLAH